ncbi:MAG: ROK family protein [candidate division WOR-3 bacterium]
MAELIGIDVGGTNIKTALVDRNRVIKRFRFPTRAREGLDTVIGQIVKAVLIFKKKTRVGIGIAGLIDSEQGIVHFSPNLYGWNDVKLKAILEKETGFNISIINDVNAITIGEWKFGAGKGVNDLFCFTLGTGVGGGIVSGGKLQVGASSMAGEFGHTTINFNGPRCKCGNVGCLERYVGAEYIVKMAKRMIRSRRSTLRSYKILTPKIIAQEARHDQVAREVFNRIGTYVGFGLVNIIHLLDPEVIVISGGIARAGTVLLEAIEKILVKRVMNFNERKIRIVPGKFGDDAGVIGATYFARHFNSNLF